MDLIAKPYVVLILRLRILLKHLSSLLYSCFGQFFAYIRFLSSNECIEASFINIIL